jgi:hypothetical protein
MDSKYWLAVFVFCASLGLYTSTLSPAISVGDSPELISSAHTLGIAHPPGYPLFSLLGKGISFIPVADSVAYKVNLLSAFFGGLSVLFLYLSVLEAIRLLRHGREPEAVGGWRLEVGGASNLIPQTSNQFVVDRLSAFLGSITFAVSPIFWSQAVTAEVYTMNAAFFTGLVWVSLKDVGGWRSEVRGASNLKPPTSNLLYLISFLWGLSLGNHHTMIAFGPVFFLFAGICWMKGLRSPVGGRRFYASRLTPHASRIMFFFLLGLSVYLYLPIRSAQNPFMDWGDTERLGGFIEVITRWQFGLGGREYSVERAILQVSYYFTLLREQFTAPGLIIGILGGMFFMKRKPLPFAFTLTLFLAYGMGTVLFLNPAREDLYSMDVMVIPSFAIFSIWMGTGLLFAFSGSIALFMRGLTEVRERVISMTLTLIFMTIPLTLLFANFEKNDQRENTFAYDYANDMFDCIEKGGVVFVDTDLSLFPLWYMQYVEGKRRDVAVLNVDMLMLPWFKKQLREKYPTVEIRVPDVVRHAKGKGFKPLSMEALYSYKAAMVEGMLDELMRRHPVYLSYEFGVPFKEFGERKDVGAYRNGVIFRVSKEKIPDNVMGDFLGLGSILKAIESREEEALFIARAYIPSMERMASLGLSSGRRGEAMEMMEGVLTVDPYNTGSLNNLAYLYAEEGKDLQKAEKMAKMALSLNPMERGRYLKTLGFIYLKKGEYQKAADTFREVLELEPSSEWTRLRLEEAYSKIPPPPAGGG